MKTLVLILAGIAGMVAGHFIAGVEGFPALSTLDKSHMHIMRGHVFIVAAVTGASVCSIAFLLKETLYRVSLVVMLLGVIFIAAIHIIEPRSNQFLDEAMVELLIPYLGVSSPVVIVVYGIGKWLASRASQA